MFSHELTTLHHRNTFGYKRFGSSEDTITTTEILNAHCGLDEYNNPAYSLDTLDYDDLL